MAKIYHLLRFKCRGIVSHDVLRVAKPRQDIVFYEIHYHFLCSPPRGYSLDPFCEVICGSQDPLVLSRGVRHYLTNEVQPPFVGMEPPLIWGWEGETPHSFFLQRSDIGNTSWFPCKHLGTTKANKILPSGSCLQWLSRNDDPHIPLHEIPSPWIELRPPKYNSEISPQGPSSRGTILWCKILHLLAWWI